MPALTLSHGLVRKRSPRVQVDVWQVALDVDDRSLARAAGVLSPSELQRADRGTPEVRRRRIALRAALRHVVSRELSCRAAEVPLTVTPHGRPELPPPSLPDLQLDVTCTRSGDLGMVAVARGTRVGIDLERVPPWTDATLAESWLTTREVAGLRGLSPERRAAAATRLWTVKEAVLKGGGSGLSVPPVRLDVGLRGRTPQRVGTWHVTGVAAPRGMVATLATSRLVTGGHAVVPRDLIDLDGLDERLRP
ncbi:4'-phosphopantetheinyl transferase family protein [Geodermatophilus sp. SYSU D00965]